MVGGHITGAVKAMATMEDPSGVLPTSTLCPKVSEPSSAAVSKGCFCAFTQSRVFHGLGGNWNVKSTLPHPSPMYLITWSQLLLLCWATVRTCGRRGMAGGGVPLGEGLEGYISFWSRIAAL